MPRKKNVPKSQTSLSGIEPPSMKGAKRVSSTDEVFAAPQKAKTEKPENLEISFIQPPDEIVESIPEQKEHFQLPTRFGAVPVDEALMDGKLKRAVTKSKLQSFNMLTQRFVYHFRKCNALSLDTVNVLHQMRATKNAN